MKPSEYFRNLNLAELDYKIAQYIRENILTLKDVDVIEDSEAYLNLQSIIEKKYPKALGIEPIIEEPVIEPLSESDILNDDISRLEILRDNYNSEDTEALDLINESLKDLYEKRDGVIKKKPETVLIRIKSHRAYDKLKRAGIEAKCMGNLHEGVFYEINESDLDAALKIKSIAKGNPKKELINCMENGGMVSFETYKTKGEAKNKIKELLAQDVYAIADEDNEKRVLVPLDKVKLYLMTGSFNEPKVDSIGKELEGGGLISEDWGNDGSTPSNNEDYNNLYALFPDKHSEAKSIWNQLSDKQKEGFIHDLNVTDAASEHIAESWLEFVNSESQDDYWENATNWDEMRNGGEIEPKKLKGYRVGFYRDKTYGENPLSIVSNGQFDYMVLVTDGLHGDSYTVMSNEPYLKLMKRNLFGKSDKEYLYAVPVNVKDNAHKMFGGAFLWSNDSRFSEDISESPVPLHDRVEPYEEGGKIGFDKLAKKVAANYKGKRVIKKYQPEYGKTYDKDEALEVGKKVAAKMFRKREMAKMETGGEITYQTKVAIRNVPTLKGVVQYKDDNGDFMVKFKDGSDGIFEEDDLIVLDNDQNTVNLIISEKAPLSTQLELLTGKSYSQIDFEDIDTNNKFIIKEISSGNIFRVYNIKTARELEIQGIQIPSTSAIRDYYSSIEDNGENTTVGMYKKWLMDDVISSLHQGYATNTSYQDKQDLLVKLAKSELRRKFNK